VKTAHPLTGSRVRAGPKKTSRIHGADPRPSARGGGRFDAHSAAVNKKGALAGAQINTRRIFPCPLDKPLGLDLLADIATTSSEHWRSSACMEACAGIPGGALRARTNLR